MAQRDQLEIDVDLGEDFAAQIFWTDEDGEAIPITTPCRLEARDARGVLALQFATGNTTSSEATITITGSQGLLQLSCPKELTRTLTQGRYAFDLFATVDGGVSPFTAQMQKVCAGWLNAYPRQTYMEVAAL